MDMTHQAIKELLPTLARRLLAVRDGWLAVLNDAAYHCTFLADVAAWHSFGAIVTDFRYYFEDMTERLLHLLAAGITPETKDDIDIIYFTWEEFYSRKHDLPHAGALTDRPDLTDPANVHLVPLSRFFDLVYDCDAYMDKVFDLYNRVTDPEYCI